MGDDQHKIGESRPPLTLTGTDSGSPDPFRAFAAKVAAERAAQEPDQEVFDEITDLFLGYDPTDPPLLGSIGELDDTSEPQPDLPVELLVLGHLPVLASAWVSQYARQIAREIDAAVGLVKLVGGRLTIEVHGEADGLRDHFRDLIAAGEEPDLGRAIALASCYVDRWIVRLDRAAEMRALRLTSADAITVLTAADQPAVVACYRTMKTLAADRDAGSLSLAVLDSGDGKAAGAAARLTRASTAFLEQPIAVRTVEGRIGRGRSELLYDETFADDAGTLLDLLSDPGDVPHEVEQEELQQPVDGEPEPHATIPLPKPVTVPAAIQPIEQPAQAEVKPALEQAPAPAPIPIDQSVLDPEPSPARETAEPKPAVTASRSPEIDAEQPIEEPRQDTAPAGLTAHIACIKPLPARCPHAEHVELAKTDDGMLCLLIEAGADDVAGAVETLGIVQQWAREHRALLALACPGVDVAAEPEQHLFTPDPKRVRRLLDGSIRVHLLAPAQSMPVNGWVSVELN